MSSPVEIPFRSIIRLETSDVPLFLQISRQLINAIQRGALSPGAKLPGSRSMASTLGVHRKTVIAALDELYAQGWITVVPNVGTFITALPPVSQHSFPPEELTRLAQYPSETGYKFPVSNLLDRPDPAPQGNLEFTDGLPDIRIAPFEKLAKTYRGILGRKSAWKLLTYAHVAGNPFYRQQLADYLNNTRGLRVRPENILSTRGIQMGIYLISSLLLQPGDIVLVGATSHYVGNMIFQQHRASITTVPVDEHGISVDAVRELCKKKKIRMLYLTPHHHYPTTVTLSAERRIELIQLAKMYGFIVLEDDHDYDFHYDSSPLLPLASADASGMVVYVGSFCKALAPGLRLGYVVGPENLIKELGKLRRIIDRQGDLVMEQTVGELLAEGEIQRHLKKALKIYHQRRDWFCKALTDHFGEALDFRPPPGGLAVWMEWRKPVNLLRSSQACLSDGLVIPRTLLFQTESLSAMRLGFGNFNEEELSTAVEILAKGLRRASS
jgi:GntR family transcriptional regulator/MocR family aminotransferase